MAKEKKPEVKAVEKEYIIPLRKEWRKVANYRRTGRAIKSIKQFIARHMKIPDRDVSKVKLDIWLNQEIWFRGRKKPPAKIKVRAKKEGDLVKVELAELPEFVKFEKAKREKQHKPAEKQKTPQKTVDEKKEDITSPQGGAPQQGEEARSKSEAERTPQQKKEEKEKSTSVADQKAIQAAHQAKVQKKAPKVKETPIHRKALKK